MRKKRNKIPINYNESSRRSNFDHQELIAHLPEEVVLIESDDEIEIDVVAQNDFIPGQDDQPVIDEGGANDMDIGRIVQDHADGQNDNIQLNSSHHNNRIASQQVYDIDVQAVEQTGVDFSGQINGNDSVLEQQRDIGVQADVQTGVGFSGQTDGYGFATHQVHDSGVQAVAQTGKDFSGQTDGNGFASHHMHDIGVQTDPQTGMDFSGQTDGNGFASQQTHDIGVQTVGESCFMKLEQEITTAHNTIKKLNDRLGDELVVDSEAKSEVGIDISFEEDRFSDIGDDRKQYDPLFARSYGFTSNVNNTILMQ